MILINRFNPRLIIYHWKTRLYLIIFTREVNMMRKLSVLIIFMLIFPVFLVLPVSALPNEVWVDDDGYYDGITFFNTIGEGIAGVETGGTVHVAAGTYDESISLTKNLSLLGAGSDFTVIDGQNSSRAIYTEGLDSSSIIDGVTIQNGKDDNGGGLMNVGSSPKITNCTFSNNTATNYGGAIYNNGSSPKITNCTFSENTATYYGGAMYNDWSSPTVTYSNFISNTCGFMGGGIYNKDSSPTVSNCTFSNNTVTDTTIGFGGAMCNATSTPTVSNCTFSGNSAAEGGGISNESCSPMITYCKFSSNTASKCGGAIRNSRNSATIKNCSFNENTAISGGAIRNTEASPKITNCTFSGNNASSNGGAIYNANYSSPTVTNCTFSGNDASNNGGGLCNDNHSSPTITNCIIWGNSPDSIFDISSSFPSVTYSDVSGGYTGTGNIDDDPLFVDAANGDFRLISSSPCTETGTETSASGYGSVIDDIIGTVRPTGVIYDMGAYECVKVFKICSGWNLVPWLGDCCTSLDVALAGLEVYIDYVYRWNSDTGEYEYSHYIDGLGWQGQFNTFEIVYGYWIHSLGDCIWRV